MIATNIYVFVLARGSSLRFGSVKALHTKPSMPNMFSHVFYSKIAQQLGKTKKVFFSVCVGG